MDKSKSDKQKRPTKGVRDEIRLVLTALDMMLVTQGRKGLPRWLRKRLSNSSRRERSGASEK